MAAPASPVAAYVFLLAVVVFIIYGSLFPFDFVSEGLPVASFFAEYDVFANRSDAIDNFFLFVPLGIGLHLAFRRPASRATAALLSVLVLAIGVQLIQLYVPSRVASLSDAFWNTVGHGGRLPGCRARARCFPGAVVAACQRSRRIPGRADPALVPVRIVPIRPDPRYRPAARARQGRGLRADIRTDAPGPAWPGGSAGGDRGHAPGRAAPSRARRDRAWRRWRSSSRCIVAYGSLRRETLLGIAFGLAAGYLLAARLHVRSAGAAFALALCAFLITVLTPYRGQALDPGFTFTPFSHVLWQGAINDLPPLAFEALAIGAMLWAGMAGRARFRDRPVLWSALVLMLLAAWSGCALRWPASMATPAPA